MYVFEIKRMTLCGGTCTSKQVQKGGYQSILNG